MDIDVGIPRLNLSHDLGNIRQAGAPLIDDGGIRQKTRKLSGCAGRARREGQYEQLN